MEDSPKPCSQWDGGQGALGSCVSLLHQGHTSSQGGLEACSCLGGWEQLTGFPETHEKDRKARLAGSLGATLHAGRSSFLKQRPSARGWLGMAWVPCMRPPGALTSHRNQGAGPGSSAPFHDTSEPAGVRVCVRMRVCVSQRVCVYVCACMCVCLHVLWKCDCDPVAWKPCSLVRTSRQGHGFTDHGL